MSRANSPSMVSKSGQGRGSLRVKFVGAGVLAASTMLASCGGTPATQDEDSSQVVGDPNDSRLFQQTIHKTNVDMDIALLGKGFLAVRSGPALRYVRGGRFSFVGAGQMVDSKGYVLQVIEPGTKSFKTFEDVSTTGDWADCEATKKIGLEGNLDPSAPVVSEFDETKPELTSNSRQSVWVVDAEKRRRQIDIYYRRHSSEQWQWFALSKSMHGETELSGKGLLHLQGSSMLQGQVGDLHLDSSGGSQEIELNLGPSTIGGGHLAGMHSEDSPFIITGLKSDGGCFVNDMELTQQGILSAQGKEKFRRDIGLVPVVLFDHPEDLYVVEPGVYAPTLGSGPAHPGVADKEGRASLLVGYLEDGVVNCDLTRASGSNDPCQADGEGGK
jgi:flagellar hook-basal body protein